MTPEQHAQRIRQLEFALEKADYGMGMPRDYERVLELRAQLEQARKEARAAKRIITDFVHPPIPTREHDWVAFYEECEETGEYGYGATETDAVIDLTTNYPVEAA